MANRFQFNPYLQISANICRYLKFFLISVIVLEISKINIKISYLFYVEISALEVKISSIHNPKDILIQSFLKF